MCRWLPGSEEAFSWPVILYILGINILALAGLVALYRLASIAGLVVRRPIDAVTA
ncbi:MAG: hypothetical protein WD044_09955 [Dongiaceae bacterium]